MKKIKVIYVVNSKKWEPKLLSYKRAANKALKATCKKLQMPENCEIVINLSDDDELRLLNNNYMKKDKPTNVLSFPNFELEDGNFEVLAETKQRFFLGNIAVSYQKVYTECDEQEKVFLDHFVHLIVHGFLHLCGFDHNEEMRAVLMEGLEVKILKELGIANPY